LRPILQSPMKRARKKPSLPRLSRDAERLVALAQGLSASGSMLEDGYWENKLGAELARLLDLGTDVALDNALDYLYATLPGAYDVLIELAEAHAESIDLGEHQALLIAAPVLASSKYAIYSGSLRDDAADTLLAHLYGHVAASDTRMAIAPYLYSLDQLPRHFSETRELTHNLARRALGAAPVADKKRHLPETAPLLADTRYLLAVLVAKSGAPLFRWQEQPKAAPREAQNREQAFERWRAQALPTLQSLLTGCVIDVLIPDAYHVSCRESDRAIRPYGIRAALAFIESALNLDAQQVRAIVAPFGNEQPEEYRIGLARPHDADIVHGVVWPLYGREEGTEAQGAQDQITTLLRECHVGEVILLDQLFPLEYCEDCGAPMFADPSGDLVHAELPEEAEPPAAHLH